MPLNSAYNCLLYIQLTKQMAFCLVLYSSSSFSAITNSSIQASIPLLYLFIPSFSHNLAYQEEASHPTLPRSYTLQPLLPPPAPFAGNSIMLSSRCKGEVSATGVASPYLINEVISTLTGVERGWLAGWQGRLVKLQAAKPTYPASHVSLAIHSTSRLKNTHSWISITWHPWLMPRWCCTLSLTNKTQQPITHLLLTAPSLCYLEGTQSLCLLKLTRNIPY